MNKKKLIEMICTVLEKDLVVLKAAAKETYEAATGEESRPENEYDTRALEASYLAGAQAKRVLEIETALTIYKFLEVKTFNETTPIGPTAIVRLDLDGKLSDVFIVPAGGGITVQFEGRSILVLTAKSPLGEALVGLRAGDVALVDRGEETLEYEVVKVE